MDTIIFLSTCKKNEPVSLSWPILDLNHIFNLQKYIFGQYLQVKEYGNK
jgi:hypothetical protein